MNEKSVTKYLTLSLSNTSRKTKKTFDDSLQSPKKALEVAHDIVSSPKQVEQSLKKSIQLGSYHTSVFIICKALKNKWPWMDVHISITDENLLMQITFACEKEKSFNKLLSEKKIESFLQSSFLDLKSDLVGIIGEDLHKVHGSEVVELMSGITLGSIAKVESALKVNNQIKKTIKVGFDNFKPGQSFEVSKAADVYLVQDAVNLLGPEGKESIHIEKCFDDDGFSTVRLAIFVVASSIIKKWPWMKISRLRARNIIEISVDPKYEIRLNHLIDDNKIENHVQEDFEYLDANLMGIVGSPVYMKIGDNVTACLEDVRVKFVKSYQPRPSIGTISSACIHLSIEESGEDASSAEQLTLSTDIDCVTEVATSDAEAEPIAIRAVLNSRNQAALAIAMASRSVTREWPWIATTNAIDGNRLCLSVPADREDELHMLINEGEIRDRINHDFENLDTEIAKILQQETFDKFGPDIVAKLKHVTVTNLEKVDQTDICCTTNKYIDCDGNVTIESENTLNVAKTDDSKGEITGNIVARGSGNVNVKEKGVVNIVGDLSPDDIEAIAKLKALMK